MHSKSCYWPPNEPTHSHHNVDVSPAAVKGLLCSALLAVTIMEWFLQPEPAPEHNDGGQRQFVGELLCAFTFHMARRSRSLHDILMMSCQHWPNLLFEALPHQTGLLLQVGYGLAISDYFIW